MIIVFSKIFYTIIKWWLIKFSLINDYIISISIILIHSDLLYWSQVDREIQGIAPFVQHEEQQKSKEKSWISNWISFEKIIKMAFHNFFFFYLYL